MGETAVIPVEQALAPQQLSREQVELVKRTVAKGTTDDELKLFLYTCARTGLDPLAKQIHAIKRWSNVEKREVMAIQTGIDGYRLIAERTNRYAPGQQPTYETDGGKLVSATAYVKKLVAGTWHEVAASAYWDEYVQTNREGQPTATWKRMPRLMLAKCAEALALRRAFPAEMSGVYTFDEMAQADTAQETHAPQNETHAPENETDGGQARVLLCPHCKSHNIGTSKDGAAFCQDCRRGI